MSEHDEPNLDDVLPVDEQATPDHRAHGKQASDLKGLLGLNKIDIDRRGPRMSGPQPSSRIGPS